MKKAAAVFLIFFFAVSVIPSSGLAASPWMDEPTVQQKMTGKLKFGVKNLLFGWTELIHQPVKHSRQEGNTGLNLVRGLGQGVVNSVVYTVGGALHVVTFPVTDLDVPLPGNGVTCMFKK